MKARVRFPLRLAALVIIPALAFLGGAGDPPAFGFDAVVVNSASDPGSDTCNPAECTLREAIDVSNANPGLDTIAFAIGTGPQTIALASPLPEITDPVIIEGTTQDCPSHPCIELDGTNAGPNTYALRITAGGSTVRSLVMNRFGVGGIGGGIALATNGGNLIEGNRIGTDVSGNAGLGDSMRGISIGSNNNVIASNLVSGSSERGILIFGDGNQVLGNRIGTNAAGTAVVANDEGVEIQNGSLNVIGGLSPGERNVISGNTSAGISIAAGAALQASGNQILGNYIGVNAAGDAPLPNGTGIIIEDYFNGTAAGNIIGGMTAGARNIISGNAGDGVWIYGSGAEGNLVQGNFIGTDASGMSDIGNGGSGVLAENSGPNIIGGQDPAAGNRIAYNGGDGVTVLITVIFSILKGIYSNSIFANDGLGIDLHDDGVTPNDPGDADVGENKLQNFPIVTNAESDGANTFADVSLNSTPTASFRIEFFANDVCDPSEFGEGQELIGWIPLETDGGGNGAVSVSFGGVAMADGQFITATATDPDGNTSEFSQCAPVDGPDTPTPTPSPTPTPTPTATPTLTPTPTVTPTATPTPTPTGGLIGDVDCDEDVDAVDALFVLRDVVQLPHSAQCIAEGDVDCDGDRDSVDALFILRHVVQLPVAKWGCDGNGTPSPTGTASPIPSVTPTPTPPPGSIDQKLTGDPACAASVLRSTVSSSAPLLQEFVPSMPTLLGIDLCLSSSGGANVQVNIRDGTAAAPGAILATASGTTTSWGDAYLHLELASPLTVTTGHMLVLEIPESYDFAWRGTCAVINVICTSIDTDMYPSGQASFHVGDFAFRTYGSNP